MSHAGVKEFLYLILRGRKRKRGHVSLHIIKVSCILLYKIVSFDSIIIQFNKKISFFNTRKRMTIFCNFFMLNVTLAFKLLLCRNFEQFMVKIIILQLYVICLRSFVTIKIKNGRIFYSKFVVLL